MADTPEGEGAASQGLQTRAEAAGQNLEKTFFRSAWYFSEGEGCSTQGLSESFLKTNEDFDIREDLNKQILDRHLLHTLDEPPRMSMKNDPKPY